MVISLFHINKNHYITLETSYEKMVSLIAGSYYVTSTSNIQDIFSNDVINTCTKILGKKEQQNEGYSDFQETTFDDIKKKPLGSLVSILFWNDQQRRLIENIEQMIHTLIMADYGTGQYLDPLNSCFKYADLKEKL